MRYGAISRPVLFSLTTLLVAVSCFPALAAGPNARDLDDIVRTAMKQWQVPGVAVVVVDSNQVMYLKGFGVRERGGKEPVTPDTIFPLASCTKAFTTVGLAMLVDEDKLGWDDRVRKHLPNFRLADPLANEQVNLRDLLCHRTGIAANHDLLVYHSPWCVDEQIRRIGLVKPSYPFRTRFQYQNIMFSAAGQALAAAAGESWDVFIRKRICAPLGMKRTSFTTTEALKDPDHIRGTHWNRAGKQEVVPWHPLEQPNPALSINSCAADLAPWLRFQLGDGSWGIDRLVSERNLAETHMPQIVLRLEGMPRKEQPFTTQMSYALGWVVQDYRGHKILMHAGLIDGVRIHIALAPDDRIGLAVLCNLEGTRMNLALSYRLFDELLGLEPHDWNAHYQACVGEMAAEAAAKERRRQATRREGTKPSRELAGYAGRYEDAAYGIVEIIVEKDVLVLKWNSFRAPLEHFHFDTFTVLDDMLRPSQAVFILGADGAVASLHFLDRDFKKALKKR